MSLWFWLRPSATLLLIFAAGLVIGVVTWLYTTPAQDDYAPQCSHATASACLNDWTTSTSPGEP